jgi:putative oxidoreductase
VQPGGGAPGWLRSSSGGFPLASPARVIPIATAQLSFHTSRAFMKKLASILRLDFVPSSVDLGLLVLRLWLGLSLLILHGWGKLSGFQQMASKFPDPLNIGNRNSLILALVGEVLCSTLLAIGLFTRFAALGAAITMSVAFFLVHKASFKPGPGSGELAYVYLCGFVVLFLAGAGKFSVDGRSSGSAPKKFKPARD